MKIIAFGHRKFVGKDTCANLLCTELRTQQSRLKIEKKGFADKLKDIAHSLYSWAGLKPKEFYDIYPYRKNDVLPMIEKTVRQVWIDVGMRLRDVYSDTWIDYVLQGSQCDILIISDLRFPNEAEKIKALGGYCIKVERADILNTDDEADIALKDYNMWNYSIENNGSIKDLHDSVMRMWRIFNE